MSTQSGCILTLVGLFASGKSSLIENIIKLTNGTVTILPVTTTRPPRNSTEASGDSKEYQFVDRSQYAFLKKSSRRWSERIAADEHYGIDVGKVEHAISEGKTYLTTMLPHAETLLEQKDIFDCAVMQILIDTPLAVCNQRLLRRNHDVHQRLRLQNSLDVHSCHEVVDSVFVPENKSVSRDTKRFLQQYGHLFSMSIE